MKAQARAKAPIVFTTEGAWLGARAILPIVPGAAAFGALYGFLAGQAGMSVVEVAMMSALIFAGASQFLVLELWQEPLPILTLMVAVVIINLRHLLMGAALSPWFREVGPRRSYASLFFMTDESWGVSVNEMNRGGRDAAFLLGAGMTLYIVWVTTTLIGRLGGDLSDLIESFGLEFLTTIFFVVLLAGFWRGRSDLLPWLAAGAVALATEALLGGTWHILFGALAGSLAGAMGYRRGHG